MFTSNENIKTGELVNVKNHINRTCQHPLIGLQKKLNIDFIDIRNIYKNVPYVANIVF